MHSIPIPQFNSPRINTWDCNQVKEWLNSKGINNEIQTKFYNETVDGQVLLWLEKDDFDLLIKSISITFGTKLKLWSYIQQIQQTHQSTNNNSFPIPLPPLPLPQLLFEFNNNLNNIKDPILNPLISPSTTHNNNYYNESSSTEPIISSTDKNKVYSSVDNTTTDCGIYSKSTIPLTAERKKMFDDLVDSLKSDTEELNYTHNNPVKKIKYNNVSRKIINGKKQRKPYSFIQRKKKNKNRKIIKKNIKKYTKINTKYKKEYRYRKDNKHATTKSRHPWSETDLEKIWHLHYNKHWTNLQIAKNVSRTECAVMVRLDKLYKTRYLNVTSKKYLYQNKNVRKSRKNNHNKY